MSATLIAVYMPLIVSAVTILGGGIIYAWQKRLERESIIHAEKLRLYSEYLNSLEKITSVATSSTIDAKLYSNYLSAVELHSKWVMQLHLYASQETSNSIHMLEQTLLAWREKLMKEGNFQSARPELKTYMGQKKSVLEEMRKELHGKKLAHIEYFDGNGITGEKK